MSRLAIGPHLVLGGQDRKSHGQPQLRHIKIQPRIPSLRR